MLSRPSSSYLLAWALALFVATGCQAQDSPSDTQHSSETNELYQAYEAFNNIVIQYAVLLPEGYDADQAYPAILAFPAGAMGREDADEMTERLWSTPAFRGEWIVVVPLVPGEDWRTHPNHHALNDLLDHIKDHYPVRDDTFHIMGYGRMGSDIASTWSNMSGDYFSSLTTASGAPYRTWDEGDLQHLPTDEGARLDLLIVLGEEDETTTSDTEEAQVRLDGVGYPYMFEIIEGDDVALESLSNGGLLQLMASPLPLCHQ